MLWELMYTYNVRGCGIISIVGAYSSSIEGFKDQNVYKHARITFPLVLCALNIPYAYYTYIQTLWRCAPIEIVTYTIHAFTTGS